LPYLSDSDYQGLEYQYQNPEYFDPLDLPDVDLTNTAPKGTCYELWNSLFGHRTGAFIPTSGEWSALREYNKKCPLIYMPRTCCSESSTVDSFVGVNGPVKRSESNIKIHGPSTVKVNETAEYSVSGGLIGCAYELDVEGDGNMVGSTFYAPSTPGTAVIYVKPWMSDDQHKRCDFITVTIESGACTGSIGYTTLQMQVSGTQTLTVVNPTSGETYYWAAFRGSIDATGLSVTYTAPAINPNCENNPTITLTCGGAQVDSISIAINAINGNRVGYVTEVVYVGWCKIIYLPGVVSSYVWNEMKVKCYALQCNGTVTLSSYNDNIVGLSDCTQDPSCSCAKAYTEAVQHTGICECVGFDAISGKYSDCRSAAQKAAGCCPEQLMSNTRTCPVCY